jgi:hypothetical protein
MKRELDPGEAKMCWEDDVQQQEEESKKKKT